MRSGRGEATSPDELFRQTAPGSPEDSEADRITELQLYPSDEDRKGKPSAAAAVARPRRIRLVALSAGLAVAVGFVAVAALWWATGGRWMIVATPSMGRAAPVGTLVFTEHVSAAQVHIGDIISFRSPINPAQTYTHRVVSVDASGALHTRGDINGAADPAALTSKDLIGKVVARWWGIGWLVRAVPLLLVGGLLLFFATRRYVSHRWLGPLRVFGSCVLASLGAFLLKPFVGFAVVVNMPQGSGVDVTLVSTGLLPLRVNAPGGAHIDLVDGQVATVTASGPQGPGGYQLTSAPHLSGVWWIALALICLSPLLVALLLPPTGPHPTRDPSDRSDPPDAPTGGRRGHPGRNRRPRSAGRRVAGFGGRRTITGAVVLLAGLSALSPFTESALTAKVTNATNTAASNPYFTCTAAGIATTANAGFFAYPFAESIFALAQDVSGNLRTGTYTGSFTSSSSKACIRDTGGSVIFGGTQSYVVCPTLVSNPTIFTLEIWFKTTTAGGRLIGFGNAVSGISTQYDRHVYMTNAGKLTFGVYPGTVKTVTSPLSYNDGLWHEMVATLSSAGMALYVDGSQVAADATVTTAENHTGYWRVGYDSINTWTNQPTNYNFLGSLAYASVYNSALTATQVLNHYAAGH